MVTCRCGYEFENSRFDSHVRCPGCGRIYPNSAPDLFHPLTEEELRWKCDQCGEMNDNSNSGILRASCAKCGAKRPDNPEGWHGIRVPSAVPIKKKCQRRKSK